MFKTYRANIVLCPSYEESSTLFKAYFTSEFEASKSLSAAISRVETEFNVVFNDDDGAESAVGWFYAAESAVGWFYAGVDTVEVFDSSSEHVLAQAEKHKVYSTSLKTLLKPVF